VLFNSGCQVLCPLDVKFCRTSADSIHEIKTDMQKDSQSNLLHDYKLYKFDPASLSFTVFDQRRISDARISLHYFTFRIFSASLPLETSLAMTARVSPLYFANCTWRNLGFSSSKKLSPRQCLKPSAHTAHN